MKLRSILRVLSLLAFISASTAGYLYFSSLRHYALTEAHREAGTRIDHIKKRLSERFSENQRPLRVLAEMPQLKNYFLIPSLESKNAANAILDHFKYTLEVDVCYVLDKKGKTILSSNRNSPNSFVGDNFSFRPYFKIAIQGRASSYLALGTTSRKRGIYCSYPIYKERSTILGVLVIKHSLSNIESELGFDRGEIVHVIDPHGVIFISSHERWLYHLLWDIPKKGLDEIRRSKQFGKGPWTWIGFYRKNEKYAVDKKGRGYLIHEKELEDFPGWKVIYLKNINVISKSFSEPLIRMTLPLIAAFCFLIGISIFFLYRRATTEIFKRRVVQKKLKQSEERYRTLYHSTPAMLYSIDRYGCLTNVSQYWLNYLGYKREDVLGKSITEFIEFGKKNGKNVMSDLIQSDISKGIQCKIKKSGGEIIDGLLTLTMEKDLSDNPVRALSVLIDISKRKKTESALKRAKEELILYSKDLELKIEKWTREISAILKFTPSMIYMKDLKGRYVLANSKFEEIFGVKNKKILGKTDYEIFSSKLAEQIWSKDLGVIKSGVPQKIEEYIKTETGLHTYISVKFPIYSGFGEMTGVCGISTDISSEKNMRDQLQRLSGSIMANQEKERAFIARELHDELGQLLAVLRMDAMWIQKQIKEPFPNVAERAVRMCQLIDKTIEEVRAMAIRLRPGILDHLGLVDALDWFTSDYERRTGIFCVFQSYLEKEIKNTPATAIYRIVQEALTNVTRHAKATKVTISLKQKESAVQLSIRDDGVGFDTENLKIAKGLGVAGMRERAHILGGSFNIESFPGNGTHIKLNIPF